MLLVATFDLMVAIILEDEVVLVRGFRSGVLRRSYHHHLGFLGLGGAWPLWGGVQLVLSLLLLQGWELVWGGGYWMLGVWRGPLLWLTVEWRILLLLFNVKLLLLCIEMLLLSLLILKVCRLRNAINSLAILLPLTSHAHVHFVSRIGSLLLYQICDHTSLRQIGCLSTWRSDWRLMTLSNKLLLLFFSRIDLSSSAHCINWLGESLFVRLWLLFVCGVDWLTHAS